MFPKDLWFLIFNHISDLNTYKSCKLCCKRWHQLLLNWITVHKKVQFLMEQQKYEYDYLSWDKRYLSKKNYQPDRLDQRQKERTRRLLQLTFQRVSDLKIKAYMIAHFPNEIITTEVRKIKHGLQVLYKMRLIDPISLAKFLHENSSNRYLVDMTTKMRVLRPVFLSMIKKRKSNVISNTPHWDLYESIIVPSFVLPDTFFVLVYDHSYITLREKWLYETNIPRPFHDPPFWF